MATRPPKAHPLGWKPRPQRERERKAKLDRERPSAADRGYDRAWRKLRAAYLRQHPTCTHPGCGAPATEVDHIVAVGDRPDLRLAWSNLRPRCKPHHSARTAVEQGFARK